MRLHAGALHIWRADLDAVGPQIERVLDAQEQERAERIVREPARRRWRAARGVLRTLLGAYTEQAPSALRFIQNEHGKPMLDLSGARAVRFNLSHSGGLVVYALSKDRAVGVDVELVCRGSSARVYREDQLRSWVRREAEGKRLGVGVRNTTVAAQGACSGPWIAELDLGSEAVGAVAMAVAPVDFQVYAFDFRACGFILKDAQSQPPVPN
jgi:hypothetical protein